MGTEVCDDGDITDGRGCLNDCTGSMAGFSCSGGTSSLPDTCTATCGDSIVIEPDEECDDGNTSNLDGCSSTCAVETGWVCDEDEPSNCAGICGDGIRVSDEACDDGDKDDNEGCLDDCSGAISGWTCTGGTISTPDVCQTTCGDSILVPGQEQCENDETVLTDGCDASCNTITGWNCTGMVVDASCQEICGDGL